MRRRSPVGGFDVWMKCGKNFQRWPGRGFILPSLLKLTVYFCNFWFTKVLNRIRKCVVFSQVLK